MSLNMRRLKAGDRARVRFHGSAVLGNEAHDEDVYLKEWVSDIEAVFSSDARMEDDFTVAFHDSRWRYGTSAEVFTVREILT